MYIFFQKVRGNDKPAISEELLPCSPLRPYLPDQTKLRHCVCNTLLVNKIC